MTKSRHPTWGTIWRMADSPRFLFQAGNGWYVGEDGELSRGPFPMRADARAVAITD